LNEDIEPAIQIDRFVNHASDVFAYRNINVAGSRGAAGILNAFNVCCRRCVIDISDENLGTISR